MDLIKSLDFIFLLLYIALKILTIIRLKRLKIV